VVLEGSAPAGSPLPPEFLVPVRDQDPGQWATLTIAGRVHVVAFSAEHALLACVGRLPYRRLSHAQLLADWPDEAWWLALDPRLPTERRLPVAVPERPWLQKVLTEDQVSWYLDDGLDRVAGFVHRVSDIEPVPHGDLAATLGVTEAPYALRWPAVRLGLVRVPVGGQTAEACVDMDGWVVERAPFRGNGFTPSGTAHAVPEFKIDSTSLPHGALLCRLADAGVTVIARFDADTRGWRHDH